RLLLGRLLLGRLLLGGLLLCGFVLFRLFLGGGCTPGALATVPGEQEDPAPDDRDDQREDRAAGTDDDRDLGGVLLLRGRRLGLPEAGPEARRGRRGVLSVPPVALGRDRLTVSILLRLPVATAPTFGRGLSVGLVRSPSALWWLRHVLFRRPLRRRPLSLDTTM